MTDNPALSAATEAFRKSTERLTGGEWSDQALLKELIRDMLAAVASNPDVREAVEAAIYTAVEKRVSVIDRMWDEAIDDALDAVLRVIGGGDD